MPKASFNCSLGNRFMLASDSGSSSEDEGVVNMDPNTIIAQATKQATHKAKLAAKKRAEEARKEALIEQATATAKVDVEDKPKREPKANNSRRYGPRNEKNDGEQRGYDDRKVAEKEGENQKEKRQRRPRNQDRKSGNPRTGLKAQEKRGGAGAGNWGVATENPEDNDLETKEDKIENNDSAVDNGEGEQNSQEPKEPEEPEEVQLSLEDYYASLEVGYGDAVSKVSTRKANDGQELKGKIAKKKAVYNDLPAENISKAGAVTGGKATVDAKQLGFQSDYNNRRGGRRNDRRPDNRPKNEKKQEYKLDDNSAFPTLGKK